MHELKSWPDFFEPVLTGTKTFELRKNDRHFAVGDILVLREFDDRKGTYTGRTLRKRVVYLLDGIGSGAITPMHGLMRGYCILGITDPSE